MIKEEAQTWVESLPKEIVPPLKIALEEALALIENSRRENMTVKEVQNRIDKFLKYSEPLQRDNDYRLKIFLYNLGDVLQHDVYNIFYGKKSKVKCSFKIFCADAIIQLLIYLRQKGADLEEIIELGLDKVTRDREYKKKL